MDGIRCRNLRNLSLLSQQLTPLATFQGLALQVLKVGGAGHKVLLLMEGAAHAYVFPSPGGCR
jgi:hypothetical protein